MRFDDSLKTVLAADASTAFGAQSAFRQLVDMAGRGRVPADAGLMARLAALRPAVPVSVRAASARALALARPDAALVAFFAEDEPSVAAPVLRTAQLDRDAWDGLLPKLGTTARGILRQRTDLDPAVVRALETFGPIDLVLSDDRGTGTAEPVPVDRPTAPPIGAGPFVALGEIARTLPFVTLARQHSALPTSPFGETPRFEIADLVDRINAFQQRREDEPVSVPTAVPAAETFRFESDAAGTLRWTDHPARGALIGLSLNGDTPVAARAADGVASGALRRRASFTDARLVVPGGSDAAGAWRISAVPVFDPASGRFLGHRGTARRPRVDEDAVRPAGRGGAGSESLRRLVHELRTPTTAIAGFAELIDTQLFGPVPPHYRERARLIGSEIGGLIAAIEDLDTAARIEGAALDMMPGTTLVIPALKRIVEDLAPLSQLRGCIPSIAPADVQLAVAGDERVVERLLARLVSTLVSAAGPGERVEAGVAERHDGAVEIRFDRPRALAAIPDDALLAIDAEAEAEAPGAPLLGTGFALRLARNLATQLGGNLTILPDLLVLVLPAGAAARLEQATNG